jgi:hypothetical protein
LRHFGALVGEHIRPQSYVQWQQAFDPLLGPGARNYWKSLNFTELQNGLLNTIVEFAGKLPSPQCELFFGHLAGVSNEVSANATAYGPRDM